MKKSLSHLSEEKQEDLRLITQYVVESLADQCEMIILYGSYARGNYVEYDQRVEFGIPTYFMSDFDILVITRNDCHSYGIKRLLEKVEDRYYKYKGQERYAFTTRIHFIDETIKDFNKGITKSRYFYNDIKKDGILLYDSGNCKLARRRKLNFSEIEELAKEYFDAKFKLSTNFMKGAYFYLGEGEFNMAAFHLHQVCENLYHAIILTHTLYTFKDHNLEELIKAAKTHTLEITKVFPHNSDEEIRLFNLLLKAYIEARYNRYYTITKEDIEALIPRVELLAKITKEVCENKIKEYASRARG
ncbi:MULTISPECIES: HEPN domain-containing protein [Parabacteroides]|uniref:HEPN domain-containing protein n=1 Tax=Parabacteroides leei TaxID=2939491 RepID=UPI00189A8C4D|nr:MULTISPECIES: HEPN domain-containing protein [Parabacteroides]MCL3853480.1 HEPN domain-containing protein [Parabacteroides leei]